MKVKQNYVSNQYHQVYFTFVASEINEFFEEVLINHGISDKEAKKQSNYIVELVQEKIEDIIEEEISKLEVVPISARRYRYLTRISRTSPLLVICQFPILPSGLQIKLPTKIPKGIFEFHYIDEVINDFTRQILILNDEFEYKEAECAEQGSVIKYDIVYMRDDLVISEIADQEISLDDVEQPDRAMFLNASVGSSIILDEDENVVVKAIVKEIKNLVVKKLTNKVVESLRFLHTKTVSQFRNKIKEIFTFSTSVVVLLNFLADFVLQTGDIQFDDYIINHFLDHEMVPKTKKEQTRYLEEVKKEIVKEYIIWIINLNSSDLDPIYMDKIVEEYEFEKILFNNPMRIDGYQEFIARHTYEVRVFQYCIEQNIIEL